MLLHNIPTMAKGNGRKKRGVRAKEGTSGSSPASSTASDSHQGDVTARGPAPAVPKSVYGNVKEATPHDAPTPKGKRVVLSCYKDANDNWPFQSPARDSSSSSHGYPSLPITSDQLCFNRLQDTTGSVAATNKPIFMRNHYYGALPNIHRNWQAPCVT